MKTKYFLFMMLVCLVFVSCKGKKNKPVVANPTNNNETLIYKPMGTDSKDYQNATKAFEFSDDFKTLETQFSLKIESPQINHSGSGTLRIAKDSVMWLYIKVMGLEIARAKFTQDSVFAVVKLKNQYFKGDYSLVQKFIPLAADYNILQSLFLNKMFIVPENKVENLDYFSMEMNDNNLLKISTFSNPSYSNHFKFNQSIEINTEISRMVATVVSYPEKNINVNVNYSDYQDFSGHTLPKNLSIMVGESNLKFETNKAVFDKILNFPLNIPDSYKPFQF